MFNIYNVKFLNSFIITAHQFIREINNQYFDGKCLSNIQKRLQSLPNSRNIILSIQPVNYYCEYD
jgi:hypothetical protein